MAMTRLKREPTTVRAIAWGLIKLDDKNPRDKHDRKQIIKAVRAEMDGSGYSLHVGPRSYRLMRGEANIVSMINIIAGAYCSCAREAAIKYLQLIGDAGAVPDET
jgi:hypothetical protein